MPSLKVIKRPAGHVAHELGVCVDEPVEPRTVEQPVYKARTRTAQAQYRLCAKSVYRPRERAAL